MHKIYKLMLLPLTLGLLLVVASFAGAAPLRPPQETEFVTDVSVQGYDDNYLEVGVEWVENYSALGWSNLPATEPDALGLYNRLGNCGWIRKFKWHDSGAWEQDWKGATETGGGTEQYYVDNVDLAYFAGHGGSTAFYFNSTVDDHSLSYSDCRGTAAERGHWGDKDAEWIGIAACNVLDDSHQKDWSYCFDGLHLLMSFKTTMADVPHGDKFGQYICAGWNMTAAWFKAADVLQPQGKIARVLAEEYHHFWDRPYNHNSSDAMNYATYFKWTHTVGSEPARYVEVAKLAGTMPVFQTPPLSLGEADAAWTNLGTAFGVDTQPGKSVLQGQDNQIWVSDDGQLEMDTSAGLFAFVNQNELWAPPPTTTLASSVHMRSLSAADAKGIADTFLNNNGLLPGDAQYYETVAETVTEAAQGEGLSAQAVTDTLTSYQVIYSRIITYTTPLQAEPMEFSVMGPGSKLKVYVDTEAPAKLSLAEAAQGAVIGGMGGWRSVGSQKLNAVAEVTILSLEQITALFDELESTVALSYVPLVYESRDVLTYTVGYYEHPMGTGQDQLIPVYILEVDYALTNGETVSSTAYIPANEQYMAPFAQITGTDGIPAIVAVGDEVTMEAVDATTQLSAMGYDASLGFALGTGDPDSYLYSWYLDTVSLETKIGTGRFLTYTVTAGSEAHPSSFPLTQSIILQVEDVLSPRPPSTSIDSHQLNVGPPVYLPSVLNTYSSE
jgi:hypothetical protein